MFEEELLSRILSVSSRPTIGVVGDVMIDQWFFGESNRTTEEFGGHTKVHDIVKEDQSAGGAANVARNLVGLGAKVYLFSVTGCDAAAQDLTQLVHKDGVFSVFVQDRTRRTTKKTRLITDERIRFDREDTHPIAFPKTEPLFGLLSNHQDVDLYVISDYQKGLVTREVVEYILSLGKQVIVDPKGQDWKKYIGVHLVKPNVDELQISGSAKHSLMKMLGCPLVVTKGCQGLVLNWLQDEKICEKVSKPYVVPKFVDAIGAGDATDRKSVV